MYVIKLLCNYGRLVKLAFHVGSDHQKTGASVPAPDAWAEEFQNLTEADFEAIQEKSKQVTNFKFAFSNVPNV